MRFAKQHIFIFTSLVALAGCSSVESQRIDLADYSPVIDVEGEGKTTEAYEYDIAACRKLGVRVQAVYEERRKTEQQQATKSAIVGTLVGAALGHAVGSNNDRHTGRSATTGAAYGAAIGGISGTDAIDFDRQIAKFGRTIIIDKCMTQRGWNLLSTSGLGSG